MDCSLCVSWGLLRSGKPAEGENHARFCSGQLVVNNDCSFAFWPFRCKLRLAFIFQLNLQASPTFQDCQQDQSLQRQHMTRGPVCSLSLKKLPALVSWSQEIFSVHTRVWRRGCLLLCHSSLFLPHFRKELLYVIATPQRTQKTCGLKHIPQGPLCAHFACCELQSRD